MTSSSLHWEDHLRRAVLITGVFGSGKSSVAVEIVDLLEQRHLPYALLDLDYLAWFDVGGSGSPSEHQMLLKNLAQVVDNYLAIGVQYFVLAYAIRGMVELESLKSVLPMPVQVVRLTVPLQEISDRLRLDVTTGRQDDLRRAAHWIATSRGAGIEDLEVLNRRPIAEVADEIIVWLGW